MASDEDSVTVRVTPAEYDAIASALGETLEALEDWELPIGTGFERDFIQALLQAFRQQDPFPPERTP